MPHALGDLQLQNHIFDTDELLLDYEFGQSVGDDAECHLLVPTLSLPLAAVHLYQKHGFVIEGRQERGAYIEEGKFIDVYLMGKLID